MLAASAAISTGGVMHSPKSKKRGVREAVGSTSEPPARVRSEEHTSELQSPCNLVCRLLLEKKKLKTMSTLPLTESPSPQPTHSTVTRSASDSPAHKTKTLNRLCPSVYLIS